MSAGSSDTGSYPPIPTVDYWLAYPRTGNAALMSSIAEIAEAVAAGRAVGS